MSGPHKQTTRRLVIGLAVLVVLVLATSLVLRLTGRHALGRHQADFAARRGAVDLAAFKLPEIPAERNAARLIEAGTQAIVWSKADRDRIGRLSSRAVSTWNDDERAMVGRVIAGNAPALELLARAADMPQSSWGIDYTRGIDVDLPDLLGVLQAARLVLVGARLDLAVGQLDAANLKLATLNRMATTFEHESVLIVDLVGIAIDRIASTLAGELLVAESLTAPILDRIATSQPDTSPVDAVIRACRFEVASVAAAAREGRGNTTDGALRLVGMSDWIVAAAFDEVDRMLTAADGSFGADAGAFNRLPAVSWWHPARRLARAATATIGSAIGRAQAAAAQRQLVRAALTIRGRGLTDGVYPSSRSGIFELAQPDPFTGELLGYRVAADGSAVLWIERVQELLRQLGVPSGGVDATVPIRLPPPR